jgi:hypothetical protein
VLRLLEDVACKEVSNARIVRVGHECMELIISDFLPSLPKQQLRRTLHVEACFVLQEVDVNTCYAASLLLWRAADTLGCVLQLIRAAGLVCLPHGIASCRSPQYACMQLLRKGPDLFPTRINMRSRHSMCALCHSHHMR